MMRPLLSTALLLALAGCPSTPAPKPKPEQRAPAPTPSAPAPAPPAADALLAPIVEAQRLRAAGDDFKARRLLDEVLAKHPGHSLAALERAELLVSDGVEPEVAAADAKAAVAKLPENPRAWKVLGQTREEAGDLQGALEAYERAVSLRREPALAKKVAAMAARLGHLAEAIRRWEDVREADPDDIGARVELALLYEKVDRVASAEHEFRDAVQLAPANAFLRRTYGGFLERQGKLRESREHNAEAEVLQPTKKRRELRPLPPSRR
jgi:tetratricopeptide (TPR) repeat protein